METQSDQKIRIVALSNLRAMCERVSGVCHRYQVTSVSRSRVHVEYSNPDEYGHESPMVAVFPCFPGTFHTAENPSVVLDILRVLHDTNDGEGWQSFQPLLDCPTLWRGPEKQTWQTHAEIREAGQDQWLKIDPTHDSCTVCDLPVAYEAHCNACGWKARYETSERMREIMAAVAESDTHACEPSEHGIARTPDVTVRAVTRSEVQS